ncbi:MAG: rhodanese-like domain-containing protein [Sediminibacterium sp.]|nr:rhodanese-like domain-containing protein [Sediminibacterium sp.]
MKEITVQELKQLQDTNASYQLIDVREPFEFQDDNLGGELIPLGEIMNHTDRIQRDKQVIIHCRSGARSANAVKFLESQGFTNLHNLKGGIMAYRSEIG